jgi:hypothetical protein
MELLAIVANILLAVFVLLSLIGQFGKWGFATGIALSIYKPILLVAALVICGLTGVFGRIAMLISVAVLLLVPNHSTLELMLYSIGLALFVFNFSPKHWMPDLDEIKRSALDRWRRTQ